MSPRVNRYEAALSRDEEGFFSFFFPAQKLQLTLFHLGCCCLPLRLPHLQQPRSKLRTLAIITGPLTTVKSSSPAQVLTATLTSIHSTDERKQRGCTSDECFNIKLPPPLHLCTPADQWCHSMRPLKHLCLAHLTSHYTPHTGWNMPSPVKVMRGARLQPPSPPYARSDTIAELLLTNSAVRSAWA